jgi:hypothetical protein
MPYPGCCETAFSCSSACLITSCRQHGGQVSALLIAGCFSNLLPSMPIAKPPPHPVVGHCAREDPCKLCYLAVHAA